MNILLLCNHARAGGITKYVLLLSQGLKNRNHHPVVVSADGEWRALFEKQGIAWYRLPFDKKFEFHPALLGSLGKLKCIIAAHHIDLLHAQTRSTQVVSWLAEKFFYTPFVSTAHGFYVNRFSRKVFPCWGRGVIAVSEAVRTHLREDFKIDESRIALIRNGIVTDIDSSIAGEDIAAYRARLGVLPQDILIGSMGRLSHVKGHDTLIDAFALLLPHYPRARLIIAGEGGYRSVLEKKIGALSLESKVTLLGAIEEPDVFFKSLDLFAMPSRTEGLGLAILEAMAHGIPVVATARGGIVEFVRDRDTGLLVEPDRPQELCDALRATLDDASLCATIAENAARMVRSAFDVNTMIDNTILFYERCIKT